MAPLGALSQAWTAAEASLPLGWQTTACISSVSSGSPWPKGLSLTTTPAGQVGTRNRRCAGCGSGEEGWCADGEPRGR